MWFYGVHKWASNLRLSSYFMWFSIFVLAFLWCAEKRCWFVYKQTNGNANCLIRSCVAIFGRRKRKREDTTRQTMFHCGSNSLRTLIPMHFSRWIGFCNGFQNKINDDTVGKERNNLSGNSKCRSFKIRSSATNDVTSIVLDLC